MARIINDFWKEIKSELIFHVEQYENQKDGKAADYWLGRLDGIRGLIMKLGYDPDDIIK